MSKHSSRGTAYFRQLWSYLRQLCQHLWFPLVIFLVVLFISWLVSSSPWAWLLQPALALAVLALMVHFLYYLEEPEKRREKIPEAVFTLFLAVLIGLFLHAAMREEGSGVVATVTEILQEELLELLFVILVLFSIGLIAQAAKQTASARQAANRFMSSADTFQRSAEEHRYGGLAAKLLRLRNPNLLRRRSAAQDAYQPDAKLISAADAGTNALATWILRGDFRSSAADSANCCRDLWFRIMRTYQEEETYDTARFELATNVRNFAFILLAMIDELLAHRHPHPSADGEEGSDGNAHEVVVVNCTPFAPKDFYNFPNGVAKERFYHEREFFGTYRRVLSRLASDDRVKMYRILLADPAIAQLKEQEQFQPPLNLAVGWPLDPLWDLVRDCARFYVVPAPVALTGDALPRREPCGEPQQLPDDLGWLLAPAFPPEHDPRKRLSAATSFLWLPFFADLSRSPSHDNTDVAWKRSPEKFEERAERGAPSSSGSDRRLEAARERRGKISEHLSKVTEAAEEKTWDALNGVGEQCLGVLPPSNAREQRTEYVRRVAEDLGPTRSGDGIDRSEFEETIVPLAGKWYDLTSMRSKTELKGQDACNLAELCQTIDAKLEFLRCAGVWQWPTEQREQSEMGLAETWLHRFLIKIEWEGRQELVRHHGPLPVWALFFADCLLGKAPDMSPEAGIGSFLKEVQEQFRIVALREPRTAHKVNGSEIEKLLEEDEIDSPNDFQTGQLQPEFLLIGERPSTKDANPNPENPFETTKWRALIAATMSEPFYTSRIIVRFNLDGQDSEELPVDIKEHSRWVEMVFKRKPSEGATGWFFRELSKMSGDGA